MQATGNLEKMKTEIGSPIQYTLLLGEVAVDMNELIGQRVTLQFQNQIFCTSCGKQTKTSFAQGYCYSCLMTAPEASECILRPELCQAHLGIARDMAWAESHCLQDHYVYLALSSEVKVGITRSTQIPTRWIDQGASAAIKLAKVPNRYTAGMLEVALKEFYTDKTSWQAMLKNTVAEIDLVQEKKKAKELVNASMMQYFTDDNAITFLDYPALDFPKKVQSLSFDKQAKVDGILTAIKGQYLIFDHQRVFNVRKHTGYSTKLTTS
jgi:hypothetical protein